MGLRDIPTCFIMCPKSFCVAGATFLRRFPKMSCILSWQVHHFGDLHRHFAWQAQHFRGVVLCVFFFADHMVRAASGDVKVKISGQTWHFVRCDEN